jgi:hypothetical protein
MLRFASKILFLALTAAVTVSIVPGQDTVKQVVKNADGTYTVIEYPVGKEVTVSLLPSATVSGAKGMARVLRSSDGTKVWLDVSGVPADTKTYICVCCRPIGMPSLLGPVTFENGVAKAEFSTPMNQFMVVYRLMKR